MSTPHDQLAAQFLAEIEAAIAKHDVVVILRLAVVTYLVQPALVCFCKASG
jgi:hypothetical protein